MTPEKRADLLRQHPDTQTLTLAGEERLFFFGKVTFDLAEEEGVPLDDILSEMDEDAPPSENMGEAAVVAWLGCLPFEPELDLDEVELLFSVQDARRLQAVMEVEGEAPASARPGPPAGK